MEMGKLDTIRITRITLIILLLLVFQNCFGQSLESDSTRSTQIRIICSPSINRANSPFYIISTDNKRLQIPEDGNLTDSIEIAKAISYVDPNWIDSINVLKGKDATDQYGILGKNGVILIDLKKGSLTKFPYMIRKKFKDYKKKSP